MVQLTPRDTPRPVGHAAGLGLPGLPFLPLHAVVGQPLPPSGKRFWLHPRPWEPGSDYQGLKCNRCPVDTVKEMQLFPNTVPRGPEPG